MITDEMLAQAAGELEQYICDCLPEDPACDHEFSQAFETKMERLTRGSRYPAVYKAGRYAAAAAAAAIVLLGCMLAFSEEAQANVLHWFQSRQTNGVVGYHSTGEGEGEENRRYILTWLPEGYELWEHTDLKSGERYTYCNENDWLLTFSYHYNDVESSTFLLGGPFKQLNVSVGDRIGEIYLSDDGRGRIIWADETNQTLFFISAYADSDTLLQMAESVKIIEK